jgi:hypothetical protein
LNFAFTAKLLPQSEPKKWHVFLLIELWLHASQTSLFQQFVDKTAVFIERSHRRKTLFFTRSFDLDFEMTLNSRLEGLVGKPISSICNGKFHDTSANHCAHFVSHVLNLDFSFDCKSFKGGDGTPANVRVHEIFAKCPNVGFWHKADTQRNLLVFVTKTSNVNLDAKKMINVPQKHIGIFSNGNVYHYSNSRNAVVKQTPDSFLSDFDASYSGNQSLFFGSIPGSDLHLNIHLDASSAPRGKRFDLKKSGKDWVAIPDGDHSQQFYVGRETSKAPYIGLMMPVALYYGHQYRAEDYSAEYDHWANLLELTGYGESKNFFNVINTYDSAKFTFGFYQLAAHTADDNLILLFHRLLKLPDAKEYFPELKLHNSRVHRVDEDGGMTDLEVEMPTGPGNRRQLQLFMNFLNAKLNQHDTQEVLQSARLIHWSNSSKLNRDVQVEVAVDILQHKMSERYNEWYDLDGETDVVCALIADIHHQGRATRKRVKAALQSHDKIAALVEINSNYSGRIDDLNEKLPQMMMKKKLGTHVYDAALNEFRVR